jgi:hypothetical protein
MEDHRAVVSVACWRLVRRVCGGEADAAKESALVPWKENLLTLRAAHARTSRRSPRSTYDPVSLPRRPCDART